MGPHAPVYTQHVQRADLPEEFRRDQRGTFTALTTETDILTTTDSGNYITGSHAPTVTTTETSAGTRSGGDGTVTHSQTLTDWADSTMTFTGDNDVTGSYTGTLRSLGRTPTA